MSAQIVTEEELIHIREARRVEKMMEFTSRREGNAVAELAKERDRFNEWYGRVKDVDRRDPVEIFKDGIR